MFRSKQKSHSLLKNKKGLYNVRHIQDPQLIELERRVSPTLDPEQNLGAPPVIQESKAQIISIHMLYLLNV